MEGRSNNDFTSWQEKLFDLFLFLIFGLSIPVLLGATIGLFFAATDPGSHDLVDLLGGLSIPVLLIMDYFILKRLNRAGYLDKK